MKRSACTFSVAIGNMELHWIYPVGILIGILLIVMAVYFAVKTYIDRKLAKEKKLLADKERKRKKEIDQERIHFFTNISEELFTPLTLIYTPANELVRREKEEGPTLPSRTAYYLSQIEHNSHRLIKLIEQMLDYERLERGMLPLQITPSDIIPRIKNTIGHFSHIVKEKNVEIRLDCPYESLVLTLDSEKVEKILSNLIAYTLKHIPADSTVWIEIKVCLEPDPVFGVETSCDKYLLINIIDNGESISPEELPHLFERYRNDDSGIGANSPSIGNGIGLHYVKELVELHKGKLIARPRQHGGMVYSFTLPILSPEEMPVADQTDAALFLSALNPPVEPQPDGEEIPAGEDEPHTILIVENDSELRSFLRTILTPRYRIVPVSDESEAYEKTEEIMPDLIIMDKATTTSGYELCTNIKNNDRISHIPILVLTAQAGVSDQIEGYASGADIYLNKPFNAELLKIIIENRIEKQRRQKSLQSARLPQSEDSDNGLNPLDEKFMEKLNKFIEENLSDQELSVNTLGKNLGFSRTSFYRKIKQLTGQTPNDFLRIYRLNRSVELIREGQFPLNEIAEMTGFGTHSHFSTCFKKHFGISPRNFK